MSNRTLIEINHDFAGEIARNPEAFVRVLVRHLNSIEYSKLPMELFPGVRALGARHHSEPYVFCWGAYKGQQGLADAKLDAEKAWYALRSALSRWTIPQGVGESAIRQAAQLLGVTLPEEPVP